MGVRKTTVPSIPEPRDGNVLTVLKAIKEVVEVAEARRGDPLDAKVSFRDLRDGGIATVVVGGKASGGNGSSIGSDIPGPGSPFLRPPSYDGLVLPGRPANVHTMAVWDGIQVIWDWPDAAGTNTYWQRAVVWASATASFKNATIVGYTTGNFFTHTGIGLSAPVIPGVTTQPGVRYYWVAWEGNYNSTTGKPDRTESNPYPWENGIRGQTAVDPAYVLTLLQNKITESHIFTTLNQRINLVDFDPDNPTVKFTTPVQTRIIQSMSGVADGIYAAIAQVAETSVSDNGQHLEGEWSLRIDLNGYVAGFGLSAFTNMGSDGSRESGSAFVIKAETFAIATDFKGHGLPGPLPPKVQKFPFIVSTINGLPTVGINGQLVVDGSITATSIQAGSIGTAQLNAIQIYTDFLGARRVIGEQFATSVDPNFRLEINGQGGTKAQWPLWYGRGTTGGSGSVFFADNLGTMKLAGELYVTGAGKFFAGNWAAGEWRVEIGGPADEFMLWAGTGIKSKSNQNFAFWIDKFGEAKFKGKLEAQFVSGEISRTFIIRDVYNVVAQRNSTTDVGAVTNWVTAGEWQLPLPPFDYGHIPFISLTFSWFGTNQLAGCARLMFKEGNGEWTELYRSVYSIASYGETKAMSGAAPNRVYGLSSFRLDVAGFNNYAPTTSQRVGIVMGIR